MEEIKKYLNKKNILVVVGASKDKAKYGYKVLKNLKDAGYKVYGINPKEDNILGIKIYPSLKKLPKKPDVAITVVPPKSTEQVVRQIKKLKIKRVWMQPGSESSKAISYCKKNKIKCISNQCIMINRIKPKSGNKKTKNKLTTSIIKSAKGLWNALPMILGTVMIISLISAIIPKSFYTTIFSKNTFYDSILGSLLGSVSAGSPITSYIFGGEMLNMGISLVAVTSFLVSWVTVGLIQLPAESTALGKKFAILRNTTSFILSIVVAIITILIFEAIK